jgi:hypothetical protein
MRKAFSQRCIFLLCLLLPGACAEGSPAKPSESPRSEPTGAPKAGEFPAVLSEEASDSGPTATSLEMQAEMMVGSPEAPDGFRYNTVIVSEGLGSFRVATPIRYSVPWRYGTPTDEILADGAARDRAWADFWEPALIDDENPRAVLLDLGNDSDVIALLITLTPDPGEEGDELAQFYSNVYENLGPIAEAHRVRVNGGEGAYVEYTVPSKVVGGGKDRVQMQVLIPDLPNEALWGVTCDAPPEYVSEVRPLCAEIAATFQPLPSIKD